MNLQITMSVVVYTCGARTTNTKRSVLRTGIMHLKIKGHETNRAIRAADLHRQACPNTHCPGASLAIRCANLPQLLRPKHQTLFFHVITIRRRAAVWSRCSSTCSQSYTYVPIYLNFKQASHAIHKYPQHGRGCITFCRILQT